jgi:hypothetical protein
MGKKKTQPKTAAEKKNQIFHPLGGGTATTEIRYVTTRFFFTTTFAHFPLLRPNAKQTA